MINGYLTNVSEEKDFLIYFTKSHWSFIAAIDPASSFVKCNNFNEKINKSLPNVIFTTALPMKEKCPWSKNPNDIKIIINECKELFETIYIDL